MPVDIVQLEPLPTFATSYQLINVNPLETHDQLNNEGPIKWCGPYIMFAPLVLPITLDAQKISF